MIGRPSPIMIHARTSRPAKRTLGEAVGVDVIECATDSHLADVGEIFVTHVFILV